MSSLNHTASWAIRRKGDLHAIIETWDAAVVARLNRAEYEAIPILQYLQQINAAARQEQAR